MVFADSSFHWRTRPLDLDVNARLHPSAKSTVYSTFLGGGGGCSRSLLVANKHDDAGVEMMVGGWRGMLTFVVDCKCSSVQK